MAEQYIVIDIGGTAIKYALADGAGRLTLKNELPTAAQQEGGPGIVRRVERIVQDFTDKGPIAGVAVSTAGMVNAESGEIFYALPEAIPHYSGVNFRTLIKERFGLPCWVENDVNCAALGELHQGAGKGLSSLFCLTVGTSIGGAMIEDGRLVHGVSRAAGEIAYMQIPGGRLHDLASTTFLVKTYAVRADLNPAAVSGRLIFDRAEAGEALAQECIGILCDSLAYALCNIICLQNPEAVILGGGIMARGAYLRPLLTARLKKLVKPRLLQDTRLEFAQLGNSAGLIGALYHFKRREGL